MNDLISRGAVLDALAGELYHTEEDYWTAVEAIGTVPSDDAVQGEWIITKEGEYDGRSVYKTVCSECGHETFYKANIAHFCPNCGARMKGGEDE